MQFGAPGAVMPVVEPQSQTSSQPVGKPKRERAPKVKVDPTFVQAARELRDRWMEKVNADPTLIGSTGKYELARALPTPSPAPMQLPLAA